MTISIAHRGDSRTYPENTVEAFWSAANNGADMIETDIRLTHDGRAVLLHDPTLERIWGIPTSVCNLTWKELSRVDCQGYKIPLLENVLEEISAPFMLDFTEENVVEELVRVLKHQPSLERFLVVTGNVAALEKVKQLLPGVNTGLTWTERTLPSESLLRQLQVRYFNPNYKLVNPTVLTFVRDKGLKLSCWTVDDVQDVRHLVEAGVDAIVSNELNSLIEELQRLSLTS